MKNLGWVLLAIFVAALAGIGLARRDQIGEALLLRGAREAMARDSIASLGPGLHAAFCGTGSPLPDAGRAGPCAAVIAGGRLFVFDAGEGASETLARMGLAPGRVEAVFLTHFHSDHIDGLGALMLQHWAGGASKSKLAVYGPEGVASITDGFNTAYAQDRDYRIAHHGPAIMAPLGFGLAPQAFVSPPGGQLISVYSQSGVSVQAFLVDHGPVSPAVGYLVRAGGRSLVISGDTRAGAPGLLTAAQRTDLLIHEALSPRLTHIMGTAANAQSEARLAQIFTDIENYHTSPKEAAQLAQRAKARALVLTHLVPAPRIRLLEGPFLDGARGQFSGPLWLARDGDVISVAEDGKISRRSLLR